MAQILSVTLNPTIDVFSETNLIQPTLKIRTDDQAHHPGGGGVNVARVINTLGGSVELLFTSGGMTGALLEDCLNRIPIKCHKVPILESTRIAYMVHEQQTGLEYRFVPDGPEITKQELNQTLKYVEQFNGDYIVVSGGLPKGAPEDTYSRMAEIANRKGERFILDSSGDGLRHTLSTSKIFLVKPSLDELENLVGEGLDEDGVRKAALELVRHGSACNVAVSMGPKGAFLASAEQELRVPARHVKVRSAVGAGDSFVGAMTLLTC